MGIVFTNISKSYSKKHVLNNINIKIDFNEVFCLLGRNGAGKSTLLNIACDLVNADSGEVTFNGENLENKEIKIKQEIGIQSQYQTLVEELNAFDYLHFHGLLYDMQKAEINSRIEMLTAYFFSDTTVLRKQIKTYSSGMKKKVSLCAAFLHNPTYLFLDEPFSSIDAIAANALCNLIVAYKNSNKCIFIVSHDLLYVNKIATHIGVLQNENLIFNNTISLFREGGTIGIDNKLLEYLKPFENDDLLLNEIVK